jgi:hypothetical protein
MDVTSSNERKPATIGGGNGDFDGANVSSRSNATSGGSGVIGVLCSW